MKVYNHEITRTVWKSFEDKLRREEEMGNFQTEKDVKLPTSLALGSGC